MCTASLALRIRRAAQEPLGAAWLQVSRASLAGGRPASRFGGGDIPGTCPNGPPREAEIAVRVRKITGGEKEWLEEEDSEEDEVREPY